MRKQVHYVNVFQKRFKCTDKDMMEFIREEVYKDLQLMITEAVYRMKPLKVNTDCFNLECTAVKRGIINPPYGLDTNYFDVHLRFNGSRKKLGRK